MAQGTIAGLEEQNRFHVDVAYNICFTSSYISVKVLTGSAAFAVLIPLRHAKKNDIRLLHCISHTRKKISSWNTINDNNDYEYYTFAWGILGTKRITSGCILPIGHSVLLHRIQTMLSLEPEIVFHLSKRIILAYSYAKNDDGVFAVFKSIFLRNRSLNNILVTNFLLSPTKSPISNQHFFCFKLPKWAVKFNWDKYFKSAIVT